MHLGMKLIWRKLFFFFFQSSIVLLKLRPKEISSTFPLQQLNFFINSTS